MALRIKSHWRTDNPKSLEENAGALAYIAWRVALERAINLHGQDFAYGNDSQRVAAIAEYLAFQLQIIDRLAYEQFDDDARHGFINALAHRLADHVQDNLSDLFGPGDYKGGFIVRLNARSDDYAQLAFDNGEPGYAFRRYFGECVQRVMGGSQQNRWVIDQAMDIDTPEILKTLRKAMRDLLA